MQHTCSSGNPHLQAVAKRCKQSLDTLLYFKMICIYWWYDNFHGHLDGTHMEALLNQWLLWQHPVLCIIYCTTANWCQRQNTDRKAHASLVTDWMDYNNKSFWSIRIMWCKWWDQTGTILVLPGKILPAGFACSSSSMVSLTAFCLIHNLLLHIFQISLVGDLMGMWFSQ
jgi:hypothetical protein